MMTLSLLLNTLIIQVWSLKQTYRRRRLNKVLTAVHCLWSRIRSSDAEESRRQISDQLLRHFSHCSLCVVAMATQRAAAASWKAAWTLRCVDDRDQTNLRGQRWFLLMWPDDSVHCNTTHTHNNTTHTHNNTRTQRFWFCSLLSKICEHKWLSLWHFLWPDNLQVITKWSLYSGRHEV